MKYYEVTRTIINNRGRLIIKEKWPIAFKNEKEMNKYMNGKWEMCEKNESITAIEIK